MEKEAIMEEEYNLDELMTEFANVINEKNKRPDEMTANMLAKKANISKKRSTYMLTKLVDEGILTRRKIVHEGSPCNGYSPREGHTWEDAISAIGGNTKGLSRRKDPSTS